MLFYPPNLRLQITFDALGVPIAGTSFDGSTIQVQYSPNATPQQITQGNSLLASWDMRIYRTRSFLDIFSALSALTNTQKNLIGNDLFASASNSKALTDTGTNIASIAVLYWGVQTPGLTNQDKALAKQTGAALYVQDNPTYLIQPSFDPSINVPGWEPVN